MPKGVYLHTHIKPKQYAPELVAKVCELYEAGSTQHEIAAQLEVSQKVIWKLMKNHNLTARVAAKRHQAGAANSSWRGDAVCYAAFHKRVESARGRPRQCEVCGTDDRGKVYEWANLTGRYEDITDYKRMCRSCHRLYDNERRKNARD